MDDKEILSMLTELESNIGTTFTGIVNKLGDSKIYKEEGSRELLVTLTNQLEAALQSIKALKELD